MARTIEWSARGGNRHRVTVTEDVPVVHSVSYYNSLNSLRDMSGALNAYSALTESIYIPRQGACCHQDGALGASMDPSVYHGGFISSVFGGLF